jgi:colanic acid biosynthesis glycosyl transferase WcaI
MRLLVITPHLSPDTAPTGVVVSRIVDEMGAAGHDVHVVTSLPWYREHRVEDGWRGRLVRRGSQGSASVVRLQPFAGRKERLVGRALGFAAFSGTAALVAVAARGPFDAVMALSPPLTLAPAGWIAARRHRCPLVLNVQDVFPDVAIEVEAITSPLAIRLFRALERFSYRRSDAVTVLSDDLAANVVGKLPGSSSDPLVRVIPNFVDTDTFAPNSCKENYLGNGEAVVISHISNFRPVKRVHDLVYAMKMVSRKDPGTKLMLIGDGPERISVERLVKRLDLEEYVTLTGFRSDVANLLKCSDVVVLCSETESAPLTLLEGMSSGLPVVATRVGGIPEIIKDGVNGLLVQSKNPEAIAEKILELNSDPEMRRSLGEAARETVLEKYTAEKIVGQYLETYESVTII